MLTPCFDSVKIACIKLFGNVIAKGSFPEMKIKERILLGQGHHKTNIHVGYAPFYNGYCYCKNCSCMVLKPYLSEYNGKQYWMCGNCKTQNYIQ